MQKVKIGLLGLGTVGRGVVRLLARNREIISEKLGFPLEITKILVRDPQKPRQLEVDPRVLTVDPAEVLAHPEVNLVVEVIGGISPAKEYLLQALRAKKSVVTANKDVLALYGKELFGAAEENKVDLFFEASAGGGIPVIRALKESLAANRFLELLGIINGTTNYILTQMARHNTPYEVALKEAQNLGYAEADPSADVSGDDAARKLAILASLAFHTRVTYSDIYLEGITQITPVDISYAHELGYVVKLLAIGREIKGEIELRVHPVFLPRLHPLAGVEDVFNAVFLRGDAVGELMFFGRGAGELPTASAVVGDIIAASQNLARGVTGTACTCFTPKPFRPMANVRCRYYLRLLVTDRPGVLAKIAGVFGEEEVSLASVLQKRTVNEEAEVVLVTHEVAERNLQTALAKLRVLPVVKNVANVIRVEGERNLGLEWCD